MKNFDFPEGTQVTFRRVDGTAVTGTVMWQEQEAVMLTVPGDKIYHRVPKSQIVREVSVKTLTDKEN